MSVVKKSGPILEAKHPIGTYRFDAKDSRVIASPDSYKIDECDTCGRKFALPVGSSRLYRNCSDECSKTWNSYMCGSISNFNQLFFYRVKVPRELKGLDLGVLNYFDFSELELSVLVKLRRRPLTAPVLVELIFGLEFTKNGYLRFRSNVVRACNKLKEKKLIRSYKERSFGCTGLGRPRIKYELISKIVTLERKCPNCKSENYTYLENVGKIKCLVCNLEYDIIGEK